MTPAQYSRHMRAFSERNVLEVRRDTALAWYTAAFSRAKKLPTLERLLRRIRSPFERREKKQAMDWRAMLASAKGWNKALGGETKKRQRR